MNNEKYETLDEVIERYIQPCNRLMESITTHKKFFKYDMKSLEELLKQERKVNY